MGVKLRKVQESDLEKIRKWRMDPNVTKYMYSDPVLTPEMQKQWFEKIDKDESCKYWVISFDGRDIGLLNITDIDNKNKRCEKLYNDGGNY